jgi:hypothetical protein
LSTLAALSTLTSCDLVATNRRQNCGAFFSCGKSRLFRGECVAAADAAVAADKRQNFRRFATRR